MYPSGKIEAGIVLPALIAAASGGERAKIPP